MSSDLAAAHARYTYRLRVSSTTETALLKEWDRCRWVWNQCVAESKAASRARETCGPAMLDKQLTGWRSQHAWLGKSASVPQQQTIRDFAKSRAKALKDIKDRLPVRQRAGMPHVHLHRLRHCVPTGQEQCPGDAGPGWSGPGWR